jgi:hypothetical protein
MPATYHSQGLKQESPNRANNRKPIQAMTLEDTGEKPLSTSAQLGTSFNNSHRNCTNTAGSAEIYACGSYSLSGGYRKGSSSSRT